MSVQAQEQLQKHIGEVNNTGSKVFVILPQLFPREPHTSLVVGVDSLPNDIRDTIQDLIMGSEGQFTNNISEVLYRNFGQDGTPLLNVLHRLRILQKVPLDNITMDVGHGRKMTLKNCLLQQGNLRESSQYTQPPIPTQSTQQQVQGTDEFVPRIDMNELENVSIHNEISAPPLADGIYMEGVTADTGIGRLLPNIPGATETERREIAAETYLADASMLEADASQKREYAYTLNPSLRPATAPISPPKGTRKRTSKKAVTRKKSPQRKKPASKK